MTLTTLIIIGLLLGMLLFALLALRSDRDRMAAEDRCARLEEDLTAARWMLVLVHQGASEAPPADGKVPVEA